MKKAYIILVAITSFSAAASQPLVLLEACNNLADSGKRLACFQELNLIRPAQPTAVDPSHERVRNAFLSIQGAVDSGLSYLIYSQQLIEPASALSVYTNSATASPAAVLLFESSLQKYKDAQTIWNASIRNTRDAGVFGRVFDFRTSGLVNLVYKYDLATMKILFNDHLPLEPALAKVWSSAKADGMSALARMEQGDVAIGNPVDPGTYLPRQKKQLNESPWDFADDSPRAKIFKRVGFRLGGVGTTVLEIDQSHVENQIIPIRSIIETVDGNSVNNAAELAEALAKAAPGATEVEIAVSHDEIPKKFRLTLR